MNNKKPSNFRTMKNPLLKKAMKRIFFVGTLYFGVAANAQADNYVLIGESDAGCKLYIDGSDLVAENCNVHIRNGQGSTTSTNSRGNLIIGYDEAPA